MIAIRHLIPILILLLVHSLSRADPSDEFLNQSNSQLHLQEQARRIARHFNETIEQLKTFGASGDDIELLRAMQRILDKPVNKPK